MWKRITREAVFVGKSEVVYYIEKFAMKLEKPAALLW